MARPAADSGSERLVGGGALGSIERGMRLVGGAWQNRAGWAHGPIVLCHASSGGVKPRSRRPCVRAPCACAVCGRAPRASPARAPCACAVCVRAPSWSLPGLQRLLPRTRLPLGPSRPERSRLREPGLGRADRGGQRSAVAPAQCSPPGSIPGPSPHRLHPRAALFCPTATRPLLGPEALFAPPWPARPPAPLRRRAPVGGVHHPPLRQ